MSGLVLLVASWLIFPGQSRADWAVLTIRSINDVMGHARYFARLVDREDLLQQFEQIVRPSLERGIDLKRPVGLAIRQFAPDNPPVVLFVPVTGDKEFVEFLNGFGLEAAAEKEGIRQVILPGGNKAYLRFAHNYAFVAMQPSALADGLMNPMTDLPAEHLQNLFLAQVRLDQIPSATRQFLFGQVEREISKNAAKQRGESEAQFLGRQTAVKVIRAVVRSLLLETQTVSLRINVDEARHQLTADLKVVPVAGTVMSKQLAAVAQAQSLFTGIVKESAAHMSICLPLAYELRRMLDEVLDSSFQEEVNKLDSIVKKAVAEKVYRTLEPTLKQDALDFAVQLAGPHDNRYALVAAVRLRDGKRVESLLRDLVREMPERDRQKIALYHQQLGTVAVHRVELPPMDEEGTRVFGASVAYVAFLDNALLVGLGRDGASAIKSALIQLGSTPLPSPVVQVHAAVRRLGPLAREDAERLAAAMNRAFSQRGDDHVRLEVRGGPALQVRLEFGSKLVKLAFLLSPLGDNSPPVR
jgi:hypothetical protein